MHNTLSSRKTYFSLEKNYFWFPKKFLQLLDFPCFHINWNKFCLHFTVSNKSDFSLNNNITENWKYGVIYWFKISSCKTCLRWITVFFSKNRKNLQQTPAPRILLAFGTHGLKLARLENSCYAPGQNYRVRRD